jgi:hypothetical protein
MNKKWTDITGKGERVSPEYALPQSTFFRINRSYIINREQIDSFDNNDVFIKSYEIAIGNFYRDSFFEELMGKGNGSVW